MKTLSVRQPWAWLIVAGYKPLENRGWKTSYRGPVLIQAAQTIDKNFDYEWCEKLIKASLPLSFRFGGIIGSANLVDCIDIAADEIDEEYAESPWFIGRYGFVLKDAKILPFHPCKGKLGLFDSIYPDREQ